ncbi:MAG: two-component system sensor histidine kinase NtrB [Betaproteobacteria bacterium]
MSVANADQAAPWAFEAVDPAVQSKPFRRSMQAFNGYRLFVAVFLLAIVAIWGNSLQFASRNVTLFGVTAALYVVFSVLCFGLVRLRWRFNLQITIQAFADILFIVVLMHASGGISSGLGLLLLATLAAVGLISRGRLALFHAALASIAVLLEHTYSVLRFEENVALYVQAGLMSVGYFATAWLAHALAQYAAASERLAAQREVDLANLAQVNQLVIQDMQDGVLVVDAGGAIRQINARAERLLGPLSQEYGMQLWDYAPALAATYERWRGGSGAVDANSGPILNNAVNARFVPIGRTRQVGAVIFLEDLSRVQAQARQMKLAALGRLAANIAHEVRNPLGSISHAAELMQEEPAVTDTTRRLLSIIHDNSRRLDRMVNDVLQLDYGSRAQRECFWVADFVQTFVEQFCEIEKIRPEFFAIELKANPRVLFDRSHLDQVMWNLCRNALRYCRRQEASIRIAVDLDGLTVKLDVIDDGPGVAPELRSQLFEPFCTASPGGSGLGLYIAREVCEANGATLEYVETESGAQFTVNCRTGEEVGRL